MSDVMICQCCGVTLALGPANDDSPEVQLEIRLADNLAAINQEWGPISARYHLALVEIDWFASRDLDALGKETP